MNIKNTLTIPQPLVKVSNVITIAIILLSWVFALPFLNIIPIIYFGLGAFLGKNPIITIGKKFLNKHKTYIMEDKEQLQFNSTLAFIMLVVAVIFSFFGLSTPFFVFTALCAVANLGAFFGYCIGCFIRFQWKQFKYRRNIAK